MAGRKLIRKPVDGRDGVIVSEMTASNKGAGFESSVGEALSPDCRCLMVAVDKDWGLLPCDSELHVHWESNPEFVGGEGDISAEDGGGIGDGFKLNHSRNNIDTSSKSDPINRYILSSNTIQGIFGVTCANGGSSGINCSDPGNELSNVCPRVLFSGNENEWLLTVSQGES